MIPILKKGKDTLFLRYFSNLGLNTQQILAVLVAIIFLTVAAYSITRFIENLYKAALQNTLLTLLQSTTDSVRFWSKEQQLTVENIAQDDHVIKITQSLLKLHRDKEELQDSYYQWQLRYELRSYVESGQYDGYFIIAPDNISLSSSVDSNIGTPNLLARFPELLAKVRSGETRITPIQPSDVPLLRKKQSNSLGNEVMFVASPIRDQNGTIIAVLTLRINPYITLLPITSRANIGKTGESYVFNNSGMLLSRSRFDKVLIRAGLLKPGQSSASNIKLLDPGWDISRTKNKISASTQWPLTRMAASAINGESGIDLEGYRDYRGVPVIGAWHWDSLLGIGFAIEQDVAEAYGLFNVVRMTTMGGGIISALILLVLTQVFILGKRKIARVQKRLQSIVETASEGIVVINQWGIVESVNPAIEKMFGYSAESLINKNLNKLMPEPIRSRHNSYLAEYRKSDEQIPLGKARESEARRSNGDIFPIELTINRIELDTGLHFAGVIRDVSNRKLAERELEHERDFTREVLDSLSAHIAVMDETGSIGLTNRAWDRFAQRNQKAENQAGDENNFTQIAQQLPLLCSDESLDAVQKLLEILNGELSTFTMKYPCNTVDGQQWFEMKANRFVHRNRPKIVLSHTDISQQVESEQTLKKANERMRITALVAENTDNAVIVTDLKGVAKWVNHGFTRLSGYEFDEIIGHKTSEILYGPDTDTVIVKRISDAIQAGERIEGEILNYQKNGSPYWINFEISPVYDDQLELVQFVILQSDITEEKRLLADLQHEKEATEQANNILSMTQQALNLTRISEFWIRTSDGQSLRVNDQACHHLGYSKEEMLKLRVHDYDPNITDENYQELIALIIEKGWWRLDSVHRNKQGKLIPVEVTIVYLPDSPSGEPISIAFAIDTTERKQSEQALIKAKEEAVEANRAKSTFLATMSHEIRTPLYGVVGTVDMLSRTKLDSMQQDLINTATDSATLLQSIIDDILDFSKIEAGRLELEKIPLNLETLVEKLGDNLRHLAEKRAVELLIYCDPELPEVLSDPVRLSQILYNLAGNAIKFSSGRTDQDGKVSIYVLLKKIRTSRADICFRVSDNGIGMSAEIQKRLFMPFVQGEEETTRRFGGTGLGLVITERLVEMMSGYIEVASTEGKGSTFDIFLSLKLATESSKAEESNLNGLKVVLVSNNDDLAWVVSQYLEHSHVEVISVPVEEAIDTCLNAFKEINESLTLIVIIAGYDRSTSETLQQTIREAIANDELRFVVLERGQRQHPRPLGVDGMIMDINAMHRAQLLNTVAAVAGLESPMIEPETPDEVLIDTPLSAKEAIKNNKLILLADDNATNRKLIVHQLSMLGYFTETAKNGSEALEMWRKGNYSLVMTDCHMPVMDGYQLSQTIRSEEASGKHIPIVAITADAMRGTAQKCIAAGMDDYLTKPAQLNQLQIALDKWIPDVERDSSAMAPIKAPQRSNKEEMVVNPSILGELLGSQDREMLAGYYQEFLQSCEPTIEQIRTAYSKNDLIELSSQAHKLKSSARAIGADSLADCCLAIEMAGKEDDARAAKQQQKRFFTLFDQVKNWINQYEI